MVPLRRQISSTSTVSGRALFTSSHSASVLEVLRWEAWSARMCRIGAGFSQPLSRPISSATAAWNAVTSSVPPIWACVRKFRREPVASTSGRPINAQPDWLAANTMSRATSLV